MDLVQVSCCRCIECIMVGALSTAYDTKVLRLIIHLHFGHTLNYVIRCTPRRVPTLHTLLCLYVRVDQCRKMICASLHHVMHWYFSRLVEDVQGLLGDILPGLSHININVTNITFRIINKRSNTIICNFISYNGTSKCLFSLIISLPLLISSSRTPLLSTNATVEQMPRDCSTSGPPLACSFSYGCAVARQRFS